MFEKPPAASAGSAHERYRPRSMPGWHGLSERWIGGGTQGGDPCPTPLLLRRAWRELFKQLFHALIKVLNVLVGVVGERVARGASPYQLLRLGIE